MALPEVDGAAFVEFKRYLYSGCAAIHSDTVIELLRLSDMHGEDPLKKECGRFLKEKIDKDNLHSMLQTAHDFGERSLFGHCVSFLSRHMTLDDLKTGADGVAPVSEDCVLEVLRSDHLEIPELEIFNWARQWCAPSCALEGMEKNEQQSPLELTTAYFSNSNEMGPTPNDAQHEAEEAQRRLAKAVGHIRFPLIGAKDLLTTVKPLGIVPSDILLEAIA